MRKKLTRKKLITKLDNLFSKYIRLRNADQNGYCRCCTCGEKYHWSKIQAGHFISRRFYATRWDDVNVNPQCVGCNVFRAGEQYKYSLYLGKDVSLELSSKSRGIAKFDNEELEEMITMYKKKIDSLGPFDSL